MTIDTAEIKTNIDCRLLTEDLLHQKPVHKSAKAWQWNCPFHQDKATPSFTVYRDGYKCFGCGANGDQISLVKQLLGLSFTDACAYLMRKIGESPPMADNGSTNIVPKADHVLWHDPGWQTSARRIVREGMERMPGSLGADYLFQRGIKAETAQAYALGYEPDLILRKKQAQQWVDVGRLGPAVVIPWQADGLVQAIQYRLIQNTQRRFHHRFGGEQILFGIDLLAGRDVLFAVEGELNGISIWQECREVVDVVSFGSETNIDKAALVIRKLSEGYQNVVVWADKPNQALGALERVQTSGIALQSPSDLDANDLLRRNQLADFINSVLNEMRLVRPCEVNRRPETIVLAYPVGAPAVTVHGKWRRLEDGRIEAEYSRAELIWAMVATGYQPTAEEMAIAAKL